MRRQLRTPQQNIQSAVAKMSTPRVRQAFLVDTYTGYANEILVQFNDPKRETRGVTVKAKVRPGVVLPSIAPGSPVSVVIRHGQVEIIGLSSSVSA